MAMLKKPDCGENDDIREDANGVGEIFKKYHLDRVTITVILALAGLYIIYNVGYCTGELIYNLLH